MIEKAIEFLFQLAGAIVFWSEIFSTVVGMAATVYISFKLSKVINGDNIVHKALKTTTNQ